MLLKDFLKALTNKEDIDLFHIVYEMSSGESIKKAFPYSEIDKLDKYSNKMVKSFEVYGIGKDCADMYIVIK